MNIASNPNPVLLDRVIQGCQAVLLAKLKWLDCAFGRTYKLAARAIDGSVFTYPAVYTGRGEYLSVVPDDTIGNFSFFDIQDPQSIEYKVQGKPRLTVKGALVFWYDLTTIYADTSVLHTEEIKAEILQVLSTPGFLESGRIQITNIYEKAESIYKGYSLEKIYAAKSNNIDKQFFIHPYAAIKIE
ncbi:MAG: hypothetical protein RR490_07835, partial [Niameybacter sp.]